MKILLQIQVHTKATTHEINWK